MNTVSVVIPAHNSATTLRQCLSSLSLGSAAILEVIVVDDASTDGCARIAQELGARVLTLDTKSGAARARNVGARVAKGAILFFIDADVCVHPKSIELCLDIFHRDQTVAAVFGSYDKYPVMGAWISQYKNLSHHYVHQHSATEASTFWTGCGAIRRDVFEKIGGFNEKFLRLQDVEMGYRLNESGFRILLCKEVLCCHFKKWTLYSWLKTDLWGQAYTWSRLILAKRSRLINDLNLRTHSRWSVFLNLLIPLVLLLPLVSITIKCLVVAVILGIIILLNQSFYKFMRQERGFLFMLFSFVMHGLYHTICAIGFGLGILSLVPGYQLSNSSSK